MVPSETDSPIAGMTTSTVVSTAIWCLDHTAFREQFLPAAAALADHESDAAGERSETADDRDRQAEPERDDPAADGIDAEQRDDDPADAVRPAEDRLRGLLGDREHEQRQVDARVGEREVLQAAEGDHAPPRILAMCRSGGAASSGHAS